MPRSDEMAQLKDSVQYLKGSTDILLIAPHGKPPNSDANSALLTEILAEKLECSALINNVFPRAKRNYNLRNDAEKDKTFIKNLRSVLDADGTTLVIWIHGFDRN